MISRFANLLVGGCIHNIRQPKILFADPGFWVCWLGGKSEDNCFLKQVEWCCQNGSLADGARGANLALPFTQPSGNKWTPIQRLGYRTGLLQQATSSPLLMSNGNLYLSLSHEDSILSCIYGWQKISKKKDLLRWGGQTRLKSKTYAGLNSNFMMICIYNYIYIHVSSLKVFYIYI